ncbi:MAG: hypothetical protein AAF596_07625 [Planctomycetota bacterium]
MRLGLSALSAALVAVVGTANAAIIVQYPTAGSVTSLAAEIVDPSVTADDLTAGSGLAVNTFSTFNFDGYDTDNTSFADAVADDEVFLWGFDVTSPVTIDLTTFDIRPDRSGTGPDDFEIQVSVNGGAGISVLSFDFGDSTSGVDFIGVDLSAVPTLSQGDSVVFTLAAFNSESTAGSFDLETVDFGGSDPRAIRIEGDITASVIPEPGAALLAMLGMTFLGAVGMRTKLG